LITFGQVIPATLGIYVLRCSQMNVTVLHSEPFRIPKQYSSFQCEFTNGDWLTDSSIWYAQTLLCSADITNHVICYFFARWEIKLPSFFDFPWTVKSFLKSITK